MSYLASSLDFQYFTLQSEKKKEIGNNIPKIYYWRFHRLQLRINIFRKKYNNIMIRL